MLAASPPQQFRGSCGCLEGGGRVQGCSRTRPSLHLLRLGLTPNQPPPAPIFVAGHPQNVSVHQQDKQETNVDPHAATERDEVAAHATTWVLLEDVMLWEGSQTQKAAHCVTPCA